jgi:hypothetical protein
MISVHLIHLLLMLIKAFSGRRFFQTARASRAVSHGDFFLQLKNLHRNVKFDSDSERWESQRKKISGILTSLEGHDTDGKLHNKFLPPRAQDDLKCCAPGRNKKVNDEPRISPKEASHSIDC